MERINSSNSIIAYKSISNSTFQTRFPQIWIEKETILFYIELNLSTYDILPVLLDFDLNFTINWKFTFKNLDFNYFSFEGIDIVQDMYENYFIIYPSPNNSSSSNQDITIQEINSSGEPMSKLNWGSIRNETPLQLDMDSNQNLYFICECEYVEWRKAT